MPPEVEHRAYYRQPVWKRIVVIAAGPGGEHRPRLRDPLLRRLRFGARQADQPGRQRSGRLAGGEGPAGQATGSSPSTAIVTPGSTGEDAARTLRQAASPRTNAPASRCDGCVAATPVALTIEPRRQTRDDHSSGPTTTRRAEAGAWSGFAYGGELDRPQRRRRRRLAPRDTIWVVTSAHRPTSSPTSSNPKQRKQISGVVGTSDVGHQAIEAGMAPGAPAARPGQPLAGPDQPAADPAARRRPHLLGDRRETARRQAGLAAGDGAGQRDRLRPGR